MKIITTHLSADFDAFASAICAQRLYPGYRILFPGSLEPTVRRFRDQIPLSFDEIRLKELRRHRLEDVIILDTPDSARLGEVWDLIQRDQCPIIRIDHHGEGDLPVGNADVLRPGGSTSTLIAEIFQNRGLHPSPEEASLLLLGIYEDTGRLTFRETGPADFRAAAWLLEQGGDMRWIRQWISRTLEPDQLQLLRLLVDGAEERIIASIPVIITTVEVQDYPEEAAAAIHQWIEAFRLPVVAVLLTRPPNIRLILRSRIEDIDVGVLAGSMGGGGHHTAASATIRGKLPVEIREELWKAFRHQLPEARTAGTVALRQIFHLDRKTKVAEAATKLNEWRINAIPVSNGENGDFSGTLTRQILDRSIGLGMGDRPIEIVMEPGVLCVDAEAPLEEVKEVFLEGSRRFVIVTSEGRPLGILTRMEVFRRLFESLPATGAHLDHRMASLRPLRQNIAKKLRESLPSWVRPVLKAVQKAAPEGKPPIYLVGGAVRDLLLGRPIEDVDLVVEGDGIKVAHFLASAIGGRCHPHKPFLTAVISLPDGHSIDVASARTEFYTAPAALPSVVLSLIRQDLYRRDFTINALAISLSGSRHGQIIDFFGGRKDLDTGIIRVLHSLSFIDDPTRAIRAVRYARRLDFEISRDTRYLIETATQEGVFEKLSAHRLRHELELLLTESHPAGTVKLLAELSLLQSIDAGLRWDSKIHGFLLELEAQQAWYLLEDLRPQPRALILYLGALILLTAPDSQENDAPARELSLLSERLIARLQLTGQAASCLASLPSKVHLLCRTARIALTVSERYQRILEFGPEALLVAMVVLPLQHRRLLAEAVERGHRLKMTLGGRELRDAGMEESPRIGEVLQATQDAILDKIIAPSEALNYALKLAEKAAPP